MAAIYKVKIFSLDGQTFIRNSTIMVPFARKDGAGTAGYLEGQRSAANVINQINSNADSSGYFDSSCAIFVAEGRDALDNVFMNQMGFNAWNPATYAGSGIRIVFSNGNYATFIPGGTGGGGVYADIVYYLSDGTSLGGGRINCGHQNIPYNNYGSQCSTFPMPLIDIRTGAITDWGARYCTVVVIRDSSYPNERFCGLSFAGSKAPNLGRFNVNLQTWYTGLKPIDPDNPYEDAGTSDEGGGDPDNQNFDGDSDDVTEDSMPTLSAVGTGFATLFTPDRQQLKWLADFMWGASWFHALADEVMGIDKMFVSLGIVPFVVPQGATVEVTWLGMSITEVTLTLAAQQYFEFDMGSIDLSNDSRIWTSDTAMDYSPFSRLGIYLPFIGFQELDIDECRGKVLNLKYRIDAMSGSCVALIRVGGSTLYQFTGNCLVQIPITSQSFDEFISTVTNVAIAGANAKTAGALAGGGDNVTAEAWTREKNPITETQGKYQVMQHAAMLSHAESGLASATANAITGLKPSYNKSGAVSASNALMAVKQPYLFLSTPHVCVPEYYQRYGGYPANITDTLGNFEGFTVVNSIRLNGLVATSPEVEEIYELLHSGVII